MPANPDETDLTGVQRTRIVIVVLAAGLSFLLMLGFVTPAAAPRDVIAVVSLLIWFIIYPTLLLAGILASLLPISYSRIRLTSNCRRRLVATTIFSLAALVVIGDFWLFGVIAGLKQRWWRFDLPLAVLAITLILVQFPTDAQTKRWQAVSPEEKNAGEGTDHSGRS